MKHVPSVTVCVGVSVSFNHGHYCYYSTYNCATTPFHQSLLSPRYNRLSHRSSKAIEGSNEKRSVRRRGSHTPAVGARPDVCLSVCLSVCSCFPFDRTECRNPVKIHCVSVGPSQRKTDRRVDDSERSSCRRTTGLSGRTNDGSIKSKRYY